MTVFDPMNLKTFQEFKQVNSRLAPGYLASTLPAEWVTWKLPRSALPIDNFIKNFLIRERKPKLRSAHDLCSFHLGGCPYAMARAGVAFALFSATYRNDLEELRKTTTYNLKTLKDEFASLKPALLSAVKTVSDIFGAQMRFQELELDLRPLQDRMLATVFEIDRIAPAITNSFMERSQYRGDLWKINFVRSMFGTWWRLTGCDPAYSPSSPFLDFVKAAWQSLAPDDLPDLKWESAIETARRDRDKSWRDDPGVILNHLEPAMSPDRLDELLNNLNER